MKTVFAPSEVAHIFANKQQDNATNSGRSLFFEKDSIYSYGRHFPIAKHVENNEGVKALLFTTRRYSNTTAKHIAVVRNATSHLNKIYCFNPDTTQVDNMQSFLNSIKNCLSSLDKAKKPAKYILEAEQIQAQVHKFAEFYGIKTKQIDTLIDSAKSGKYSELLSRERKAKERKAKAEQKQAEKTFLISLDKWRNFDTSILYGRPFGYDYLRINKDKKRIETSQGVQIPIEIAKLTFEWIKTKVKCTDDCNYKIADFEVKELNENYLVAGCHKVSMEEINTIGKQI